MGGIQYRPEIDGLRAVSVLGVIFYHAEIAIAGQPLFSGGFLGVDVFFVISGYLITSLLMRELQTTGTLSLRDFYARRARRLLPVLLLVSLSSLPAAWYLLYPQQLLDFSKSLVASLLFVSNIYWHNTLQAYGAESALLKPLLHTWSLGVEEQYYILYPLLLAGLWRLASGRLAAPLLLLALASFALACWSNTRHPSLAFYLLPTRLWELLVGGLLALYMARTSAWLAWPAGLQSATPGLVLVLVSFFLFDTSNRHPGVITLVPVLGTVLVIAGARAACPATRLLTQRWPVFLGLLSYSLYLWHYPVFAFGRLASGVPGTGDKLVWLVVTALLSLLSYRLVETPFRRPERIGRPLFICVSGTAGLLALGFALLAIHNDGLEGRFKSLQEAYAINDFDNARLADASWSEIRAWVRRTDSETIAEAEQTALWFSEDSATRKLLIVGNSHSKDTYNSIVLNPQLYPKLEVARYQIQLGAGPDAYAALTTSPNYRQSDVIVISSRYRESAAAYGLDGRRRGDLEALPGVIESFRADGKDVVLMSNTVEFKPVNGEPVFDAYLNTRSNGAGFYPDELKQLFYRHRDLARYQSINRQLHAIALQSGAVFLDKEALVCDSAAGTCQGITPAGYKTFYDYGHTTLEGARYLGRLMHTLGWFREPPD